ncbi:MAG: class I SAM-dependent methyltransferase [Bacteroidota bacterium]|jgi:SAM-dependent methyltransferase|nr:class I SAM-dependent methyltransferase [Bacteroidota bacterium]
MLEPSAFYNNLADLYDGMTQFASRLPGQRQLLADLLARVPAQRAVDMGCGTGVHAVALAQLGLDVTGIDVSDGMLEKARAHAAAAGVSVEFLPGDFLTDIPRPPADLILCLGNSIPHLPSLDALFSVLAHWRTMLAAKGTAVVQLLNYQRVLDAGERIVNIRRDGDATIIRFYDFLDERLRFNILTVNDGDGTLSHNLQSTLLFPFRQVHFETAARHAGFASIDVFGSLRFAPFTSESTDLVVRIG